MPDIRNLTGQPTGGVRQFEVAAVPGQPTRIRTWGIPTGPGWFDRPGKWNFMPLPDWWRRWQHRIFGLINA